MLPFKQERMREHKGPVLLLGIEFLGIVSNGFLSIEGAGVE